MRTHGVRCLLTTAVKASRGGYSHAAVQRKTGGCKLQTKQLCDTWTPSCFSVMTEWFEFQTRDERCAAATTRSSLERSDGTKFRWHEVCMQAATLPLLCVHGVCIRTTAGEPRQAAVRACCYVSVREPCTELVIPHHHRRSLVTRGKWTREHTQHTQFTRTPHGSPTLTTAEE